MRSKCIFKKDDYESSDGMLTYVWGPPLWHFLHTMSFNYPVKPTEDDKQKYMNYIQSLKFILPCKYCRVNLKRNLKETGFSIKCMKNRETFSTFVFNLHNHINEMLGKKNILTYDEVKERYENFRSRCSKKTQKVKHFKMDKGKQCNKKEKEKEMGCVSPINGIKSKCLITIVPKNIRRRTFKVDPRCKAYI
jgi:hypothetical protein